MYVDNGSDSTPPEVTLDSPANGATVSGLVTIAGTASDNHGVDRVHVKVTDITGDNTIVDDYIEDDVLEWEYKVDTTNFSPGIYIISDRAFDTSENVSAAHWRRQ